MKVPESFRYVIILIVAYIYEKKIAARHTREADPPASYTLCRRLSNTTLDCSNLKLTAIPKDIPNTYLALNMSNNALEYIEGNSFSSCCTDLRELDLSHNLLSNIHRDFFINLRSLISLYLQNNSISEFEPETFSDLHSLKRLDLSRNSLSLSSSSKGFLVQTNLEELNLDSCNLEQIPENAFVGVKQLKNLTLTGNPFNEDFDSSAFEDLKKLTKLQLGNISKESIVELCEKLEIIDAINFDNFNVSCYYLTAQDGSKFEDAIVGNDPPIDQPISLPTINIKTTKSASTTSSTANITTTSTTITSKPPEEIPENTTIKSSEQTSEDTPSSEIKHAQVDIDSDTIQHILIGIIIVTLVGILVGLVCRADICGIKTIMCRSKKPQNRRSSTDVASPFEEIPLNTVNVNGKNTSNGEG